MLFPAVQSNSKKNTTWTALSKVECGEDISEKAQEVNKTEYFQNLLKINTTQWNQ
jgi:hypothetical protein